MICCDACQEWFHDKCVTIPEEALTLNNLCGTVETVSS